MIKIIRSYSLMNIKEKIESIVSDVIEQKAIKSQVIIKPAIGSCLPSDTGATIDLNLLEILIKLLINKNIEPIIIEAPSHIQDFDKTMEILGVKRLCNKYKVNLLNPWKERKDLIYIKGIGIIRIPKILNRGIPIIGLAKCKTHNQAGLSLGIKNLIGILPLYERHILHLRGLTNGLVGLYEKFKNYFLLSIIDGIIGMEGNGPTKGIPIKSNFVIIGDDLLLTDIEVMNFIGFEPIDVPHINKLIKRYKIIINSKKLDNIIYYYKKSKKSIGLKAIFITFPLITFLFKKLFFKKFIKN